MTLPKFIPLTSFNLGTFIVTKISYFYIIGAFNSPAERHLKALTFSACAMVQRLKDGVFNSNF
jgi:hypothetical protein